MREWVKRNPEKVRQRKRADYAANSGAYKARAARRKAEKPDAVRLTQAQYRDRNRASIRERNKQWAESNPDQARAHKAAWEKRNPEAGRLKSCGRRAKTRGRLPAGTKAGLLISQGGLCVYCKCDITQKNHLDHIMPLVLGGTHTADNVQLLCPPCNLSKGGKHPDDFLKEVRFG